MIAKRALKVLLILALVAFFLGLFLSKSCRLFENHPLSSLLIVLTSSLLGYTLYLSKLSFILAFLASSAIRIMLIVALFFAAIKLYSLEPLTLLLWMGVFYAILLTTETIILHRRFKDSSYDEIFNI